MQRFISALARDFPELEFTPGDSLCWTPKNGQIFYPTKARGPKVRWGILHELGHAQLRHQSYESEIDLIKKEAAAWQAAQLLGKRYDITIPDEHIQYCLDTYRDWLHKHSTCPNCGSQGVQRPDQHYFCINCGQSWRPNSSRFCRTYRVLVSDKMTQITNNPR